MPLSWNEIKTRAIAFAKEWEDEVSEDAEAKSFWDAFFTVFGVHRRRIASFEVPVKREDGSGGYIDLLWKGILLVEHKSLGKDLDRAYGQARDYFSGLKDRDLPRYVLVSDFRSFRLYDLDENTQQEFELKDLPRNLRLFGFVAGYQSRAFKDQDPVNINAAERMGRLHDVLRDDGYTGHKLEVLLVRLLFCLFAEDTGIFEPRRRFQDYIEQRTQEDGSNLGGALATLFDVLNTPSDQRQKGLDEQLAGFPYVNGKLFEERLSPAAFNTTMRERLLDAAGLDWGQISPAIFGALFQSIMDAKARRNLGAHYTSEKNILKLIGSLFLDGLRAEFDKARASRARMHEFHEKLAALKFLDPACGCGNFLVIAYRELRLLELDVIEVLHQKDQKAGQLTDPRLLIRCNVDQFYGIEIEEFPAQIAQLALWLVDHQVNLLVSERFGNAFERLPLTKSATIVNGNALQIDWNHVVPAAQLDYILGNPPFGGKHYQSKAQRADQAATTDGIKSGSDLDFVANWFIKAAQYVKGHATQFAFVATNSITQGEQVPLLWPFLLDQEGLHIRFAHRTFKWRNEAKGNAAVHCVIIGLSHQPPQVRLLYDYPSLDGEPVMTTATNINAYLVDGPNVVVRKHTKPITSRPNMRCGSKPTDGGNLILSREEADSLGQAYPLAKQWLQPYIGAEEFINGSPRWCLWLNKAVPAQIRTVPPVLERIEAVRRFREASTAAPTRASATTPGQFFFVSQPDTEYVLMPEVSSERRRYVPVGWMSPDIISSNKNYLVAEPSLLVFGLLQSAMHIAWLGTVGGRLESRFQYSATMVYNTFPWPVSPSDKQREAIEAAAQGVLDARDAFTDTTLADLYDPTTMPPALVKAHQALDRAVDAAYGKRRFDSDAERVAFLFEQYQKLTSLLPSQASGRRRSKRRGKVDVGEG